jgi:hypothetical protein
LPEPGEPIISRLCPPAAAIERALGGLHALHVGQVRRARRFGKAGGFRRRQHLGAAEMVDQRKQVGGRQHIDPARPCHLAALARRADQPEIQRRGADRRGQHARHRVQCAIQRQFAECRVTAQVLARHHLHRRQHRQGDRQVEVAALLQQIRRRQVDQHPPRRQRQADGAERRTHPFARLAHRLVGQADQQQGGCAARDLHLHLDRHRLDAGEGERAHAGDGGGGKQCGQNTAA